ncbi:MAG TPA: GAF domain-containing protein [Anaerolineales bacterium]|nr:GAF domain-containing protein [Anaerolineales bacterium]
MIKRLREFLKIPLFDPEEKIRLGKLVYTILWFAMIVTAVAVTITLITSPNKSLAGVGVSVVIFLLYVVCLILLHRGYTYLSATLLVFILGGILTAANLVFGGINEIVLSGYIIVIVTASMLVNWFAGIVVSVLSILSYAAFLFLRNQGLLPEPLIQASPLTVLIAGTAVYMLVIFLVYISNRNLREALQRARRNEEELKASRAAHEAYTTDLERRVVQLQVASDVARDAASLQEVGPLLDRAVDLVRERFGFYHAGIFMVDIRHEYAVLKSATGEAGKQMVANGHKLKIGEVGIVGYVTKTGQPRIALDVGSDAVYFRNPLLPETRSEMALPLKTGGLVIGALDVQSKQPGAFDEGDVNILQTMADQLAVAIANARLFEATRRQLEEMAALRAVAATSSEATSEDELIERATQLVAEVFYPDNFGLVMLDEGQQTLYPHHSYRIKQSLKPASFPVGQGIIGRVASTGKALRLEDVSQESGYVQIDPLTRSELCVPVKIGDQVIGVINAESSRTGAFSENDERLLVTFAGQLAIAFQKVRLFDAERRRVAELEALRQASLRLSSNLDLQTLLEIILDRAIQLVTADTAHLFLYEEQELIFGAAFWAPGHTNEMHQTPRPHGLTNSVARSGQRMVINDVRNHPIFADSPWDGAVCSLPLRRGDQVLGVMNLAYHGGPHNYDENELRVLDLLADQAAIALHNANLYNQARERAIELAAALAQREELDRMKDEFIQNVSHELRTPLAITRGYVELLDSGELGELSKTQVEAVNICKRRVNMLIKLVDDLVVILEAEAREAVREAINLKELVLGASADFQDAADRANLTLDANIPQESIYVLGNYSHLNRLLDNLVGNAIKFTPPDGNVTINLRAEQDEARIEVIDTGIGISPDKIEHLFERFYQIDGSTKRRYGGMGLGLSLVKEIAEAHGGKVSVQSEVGRGSSFTVILPIQKSSELE